MKNRFIHVLLVSLLLVWGVFSAGQLFAQDSELSSESLNTDIGADQETELVIEDFSTTGLGDSSSFGISLGGLFGGSTFINMHFDIFATPLVAFRIDVGAFLPLSATVRQFAAELGFGAVWRSYVINRTRFYGGVLIKGNVDPLADFDLLLIPEGFGGFEIYASPRVSIFAEFGGRSSIPIVSLNASPLRDAYSYGAGFFIRLGSRFDL